MKEYKSQLLMAQAKEMKKISSTFASYYKKVSDMTGEKLRQYSLKLIFSKKVNKLKSGCRKNRSKHLKDIDIGKKS